MIDTTANAETLLIAFVMALAGLAAGFAYFRGLRLGIELFAAGSGWLGLAGLTLARIAGLVGLLVLAAYLGATALIACFLGFLLARLIAVRSAREIA